MNKFWNTETASDEKVTYESQTLAEGYFPASNEQLGYVNRSNDHTTVSYQRVTPYFADIERPSFSGKSVLGNQILEQELWSGYIIGEEDDRFLVEVRNSRYPQIVRRIKVKKTRVVGDLSRAYIGIRVELKYEKVRELKGNVKKSTTIRIQQYADIPIEKRKETFEKKMMRYSYMFNDND